MNFPDRPRVIYGNNPLVEVLFQIRVPRTLAVEANLPVAFQESIKSDFPILQTRQEQEVELVVGPKPSQQTTQKVTLYDFISQDEILKVTLCSKFLALTTSKYENWEQFQKLGKKVINKFLEIYSPPIVTRIGLRYKNVIQKSKINSDDQLWKDLISQNISGVLQNVSNLEQETNELIMYNGNARFKIPDGLVLLKHGIVRNKETEDKGYLIDADYYFEEKIEAKTNAILTRLNRLNRYSRRVFRWCITDALHEAMEPRRVR